MSLRLSSYRIIQLEACAAENDGSINRVLGAIDPQGCEIIGSRFPTRRNEATISLGGITRPRRTKTASAKSGKLAMRRRKGI